MANPVEFYIEAGTLPTDFQGTWAEFVALLPDLVSVSPDSDWTSFVVGNTEPTSNLGPWLKTSSTGGEWFVWSSADAGYVPLTVNLPDIPDNSIDGKVLMGGTVDSTKLDPEVFEDVQTSLDAMQTQLDSMSNTLATGVGRLAVATKNAAQTFAYRLQGDPATPLKVSYGTEVTDTAGRYDPTTSRYTADQAGWYWVAASLRLDTLSFDGSTVIGTELKIHVNGTPVIVSETVLESLGGRTDHVFGSIFLNSGDYVEIFFDGSLATGELTAQLTNDGIKSRFQCWKIA